MLPPEEPERTRHVDRRSLLEEDVAPVVSLQAAALRDRAMEEEAEALGAPAAAKPVGNGPAFVGPGGGMHRDKSLTRMC